MALRQVLVEGAGVEEARRRESSPWESSGREKESPAGALQCSSPDSMCRNTSDLAACVGKFGELG